MITTKQLTALPPHTEPLREDSHAFSLDALRARESAAVQATAPKRAADSGVIDLDALQQVGPLADFTTARLLDTSAQEPASARATPRWAVASLGLLGGAVVALATLVAVGLPGETAVTQDPLERPTMAAAVATTEASQPVGLQVHAAVIPHVAPSPAPPPPNVEPNPTPTIDPPTTTKSKARARAKTKKRSVRPAKTTNPAPSTAMKPEPKPTRTDPSVECILDPASCRSSKDRNTAAAPKGPTVQLPNKLSSSQIRSALAKPKARAKQCRDMHAAVPGTTVKVKLSIAGSGDVRSATPQAPHASGLGRCVADALATAQFDAFTAPAMGVVYSVRL